MSPTSRKNLSLKVFCFLALSLCWVKVLACAERPANSDALTQIGSVQVQRVSGAVKVSISFSSSVPPARISRLTHPDRLVLDFQETIPKSGYQRTPVNMSAVVAIRTALFRSEGNSGPVTRIVLDLNQPSQFQTASSAGTYIVTVFDKLGELAPSPIQPLAGNTAIPSTTPVRRSLRQEPEPSQVGNALNDISVIDRDGFTNVLLEFERPIKPVIMHLEDPKRFVMDFPGVGHGAWSNVCSRLRPPAGSLRAIRCSQFKVQPSTVRIVLDEAITAPTPEISYVGSKVHVRYSDPSVPRASQPSTPVPAPVSRVAMPKIPEPVRGVTTEPPRVTYGDGLLTVDANNAILADVLYAISEKTGASIQLPMSNAMLDRVVLKMGPVKPRQLLATILEGSGFTYFIIEDNAGHLQKVILTPR
jgi:hypothetical protein